MSAWKQRMKLKDMHDLMELQIKQYRVWMIGSQLRGHTKKKTTPKATFAIKAKFGEGSMR